MRGKAKLNHLIVHLILLAGTIIVVFPFLWMILTSFKDKWRSTADSTDYYPDSMGNRCIFRNCNSNSVRYCLYEHDYSVSSNNGRTGCFLCNGSLCFCKN